jgi:MFS family permease
MTERTPGPDSTARLARLAVAAMFLTNGALFANLIPRLPELKAQLALDNTAYGLVVIAFPFGAIVAGLAAAAAIRRFGSSAVSCGATLGISLALLAAGLAPNVVLLMLALFLGGAMDALADVGQNAHGLRVQRRFGRSIINSFHAIWSIGAVLGGAMSAGAIALGLPLPVHLGISGIVFCAVAFAAYRSRLPGRDDEVVPTATGSVPAPAPKAAVTGRTVGMLVLLVLIAMAGTSVEDSGSSWAALYLGDSLGAPAALASLGFIALVGAQFVGRILGDSMVDRFGQRAVARLGGAIVLVGMGLALAFPTVPGTIAGFAAAGFGVATLVPAAMHAADELPGLRAGTGLTIVSWLMRLGFLCSPPLVGLVADVVSLRVALLVVPLAGLVTVLAAGVLATSRRCAE